MMLRAGKYSRVVALTSQLDPRRAARENATFTEERPMFALTLALTLGTDPTAMEMAKPPARVVDRRELVQSGMTIQEVIRVMGGKPRNWTFGWSNAVGGKRKVELLGVTYFNPYLSIRFLNERIERFRTSEDEPW